jgi:hypothetical protein
VIDLPRIAYLTGILLLIWFSLIVGMWIIRLIIPLTLGGAGVHVLFALALAKILAVVLMAGLWLYIWKFVSDKYFSWAMKKRGLELK